jgi:hypothetical protein
MKLFIDYDQKPNIALTLIKDKKYHELNQIS